MFRCGMSYSVCDWGRRFGDDRALTKELCAVEVEEKWINYRAAVVCCFPISN